MQNTAYLIWKGQNRKAQNMGFRLESVFQCGYFFLCHAVQLKQHHLEYEMHEIHGGSDFRFHDNYGITLSSVGRRLMFAFSLVNCG